ncbi:MAG: RNA-binding cell elongation regulator Jag/EloR [bacterium]|nr:RNA-binding cell elongation regulator Jag/EloR [bacterium]
MTVYNFEAKTLDEAIIKAEKELNTSREDLKIDVVDTKEKGILGLTWGKKICISVEPKTGGAATGTGGTDMIKTASDSIKTLIHLSGLEGEIEVSENIDEIIINVSLEEKDESLFIGRRGKNLEAYQYLVNKVIDSASSPRGKRVVIDCAEYRARRRAKLESMACRAAHTVKAEKKTYSFPPMPASERRIIHMTIKEEGLKTESRGSGDEKRVIVYPDTQI